MFIRTELKKGLLIEMTLCCLVFLFPFLTTGYSSSAYAQDAAVSSSVNNPLEHVVLIIVDGLRRDILYNVLDEDPEITNVYGKNICPKLKEYFKDPSSIRIEKTLATFPTVTFSSNASIVTGCYPYKHGIAGNTWFHRMRNTSPCISDYREYTDPFNNIPPDVCKVYKEGLATKDLRVKTIYDLASESDNHFTSRIVYHMYSSCGSEGLGGNCNPTGNTDPNIKWITPSGECLPPDGAYGDWLLSGREYDIDMIEAAETLIYNENKLPNILTLYFAGFDKNSHKNGVFDFDDGQVPYLCDFLDYQLGNFLDWLKGQFDLSRTVFIITADHGQHNVEHTIGTATINQILTDAKIDQCDFYVAENGGMTHIYVKNTNTGKWPDLPSRFDVGRIASLLKSNAKSLGVDAILARGYPYQINDWRDAYEPFVGSISNYPDGPTRVSSFSSHRSGDIVLIPKMLYDYGNGFFQHTATHGGLIAWDSYVPLIFSGEPLSGKGQIVGETKSIVDIAPTIAALLGFEMANIDGKPIQDVIPTSIAVTAPNGAVTWVAGTTQTIEWTYTGNPGTNVNIELYKGEELIQTLSPDWPISKGSYDWAIPSTQVAGSDYKIKITSTSNASYSDISDNTFTIGGTGFVVTAPNGWDIWRVGTNQTILWTYTGNPGGKVQIDLIKGGELNRTITLNALIGTNGMGSYSWVVPLSQTPGVDYKIRITSKSNSTFNDISNANFTITNDFTPPSITITIPVNGDTAVSLNFPVTINWNENIDCSTVTTLTVTINPAVTWSMTSCSGSQTVFTPSGQANSTTYTVTVNTEVRDVAGNAMVSDYAFSYTTAAPVDVTPPSIPTGLSVTAVASSQINLSWNASTDNVGVTGYRIYRDGSHSPLKEVTTTQTNDTGLSPSTQYCYTVSAFDAAGNESGQSSQVCDTTLSTCTKGTFEPTGNMNSGRRDHTATLLPDGKALITGGLNTCCTTINTADIYDPATGSFTQTGSMNNARDDHTATLLPDGKVLIAGGAIYGWPVHDTAEIYDPSTGNFTSIGTMTIKRAWHTATLLLNGKVLIVGGFTGFANTNTAELYDPTKGTFTPTGSMNSERSGHTATLLPNGKVLIAAGGGGASGFLSTAEIYDPATEVFTQTGSMSISRDEHTATLLPDGKVLIIGGWGGDIPFGTALSTAELYDPATGTFLLTGSMNNVRRAHTATLLPNGKVLVTGGDTQPYRAGTLNTAEMYDPDTGTFTPTGNMGFARTAHTATLLPNNKVLIAGGCEGMYCPINHSSAELYDNVCGTYLTLLYSDDFNDGVISSFWHPHGYDVIESAGMLQIQENVTDTYAYVQSTPFTPAFVVRIEMRHYMHPANDYFFPNLCFGYANGGGSCFSWLRSAYASDYCNAPNGFDKIMYHNSEGCVISNLTSSDYYNRWISSYITYDINTGKLEYDIGGDDTIDFSATIPERDRQPVYMISTGGYGWWTGHYHNIDWIRIYTQPVQ